MAILQTSIDISFSYKKFSFLKIWLEQVIRAENFKLGDISIVYTSDKYLLSVNLEFLNRDYYTDIIIFDYSQNSIINGDLLISIDRVKENSEIYSVSFKEEIDRVILHGILHLCGYKDEIEDEIIKMRYKENCYLHIR